LFGFCDVFVAGLLCVNGRSDFIGGVAFLSLIVTLRQQAVAASVSVQPFVCIHWSVNESFKHDDHPLCKPRFYVDQMLRCHNLTAKFIAEHL